MDAARHVVGSAAVMGIPEAVKHDHTDTSQERAADDGAESAPRPDRRSGFGIHRWRALFASFVACRLSFMVALAAAAIARVYRQYRADLNDERPAGIRGD
jgi:hypothetical protein